MRSRIFSRSWLVWLALSALTIGVFQNCAQPNSMDSTPSNSSASSTSSLMILTQSTVDVGGTVQLTASGGTPPYSFTIVSGPATLSSPTTVQAGSSAGVVIVGVNDSAGGHSEIGIQVTVPAVPVVGSCATPWGGSIASNSSTTAYSAANVACGSTCASQTRNCVGGVLSGSFTAQACTVAPCPVPPPPPICLDTSGSHAGVVGTSVTVPPTTQVLRITLSGGTVTWHSGGSNGDDHTCTWGGGSVVVYFGKTTVGTQVLQAGGVLTVTNTSPVKWMYGNVVLAQTPTLGCRNLYGNVPWTINVPAGSIGATCPSKPIPTALGAAGLALFWHY